MIITHNVLLLMISIHLSWMEKEHKKKLAMWNIFNGMIEPHFPSTAIVFFVFAI